MTDEQLQRIHDALPDWANRVFDYVVGFVVCYMMEMDIRRARRGRK